MYILDSDSIAHLMDDPPVLTCPYCGVHTGAVPISYPRFGLVQRFSLNEVGIVCCCTACNRAIFLRSAVHVRGNPIELRTPEVVNRGVEPSEVQYLSGAVLADFNEALV